jgi:SM-20-related protein
MPAKPVPAPHDWLRLDPALDPDFLARPFAEHGRLHIPGLFRPGGAERVHASLEREVRWRRNTEGESGNISLYVDGFDAQPEAWRAQFRQVVETRATEGFQYLFDTYPVSDELEEGRRLGLACEAVYDLFNAQPFLDFLRRLTGDPRIAYVDAQATRYMPGHFLTQHDDEREGKHRLFAYVLNLTPRWRVDWGGLLLFLDEDGHVAEGYAPKFNALNLFKVPFPHCVTQVASFAGAPRYAITGWVRARPPW